MSGPQQQQHGSSTSHQQHAGSFAPARVLTIPAAPQVVHAVPSPIMSTYQNYDDVVGGTTTRDQMSTALLANNSQTTWDSPHCGSDCCYAYCCPCLLMREVDRMWRASVSGHSNIILFLLLAQWFLAVFCGLFFPAWVLEPSHGGDRPPRWKPGPNKEMGDAIRALSYPLWILAAITMFKWRAKIGRHHNIFSDRMDCIPDFFCFLCCPCCALPAVKSTVVRIRREAAIPFVNVSGQSLSFVGGGGGGTSVQQVTSSVGPPIVISQGVPVGPPAQHQDAARHMVSYTGQTNHVMMTPGQLLSNGGTGRVLQ